MAEEHEGAPWDWTEAQVSTWLRSIGIKQQYIEKLSGEQVDGKILCELNEDFLKSNIGMKSGPAHLIIQKREKLINSHQKSQVTEKPTGSNKTDVKQKGFIPVASPERAQDVLMDTQTAEDQSVLTSKEDCRPRPFDQEGVDFIYVKHRVMQPECGAFNLIAPCHEFKSLSNAAKLDRTRLQAKFAREVLKFATGCMNIRTNGTIHFGVMDSKEDKGYVHGEIIGVPVKERDIYVDALDYIERSISSDSEHVRQCVRPPRFIEVTDQKGLEKNYVIEVDIVPSLCIVKSKVYAVRLPNFKESANKVEFEKKVILRRVGSKTETVNENDLIDFYERIKDQDAEREEAEKSHLPVFVKATRVLETNVEEQMYSLEILAINHCDETSENFITENKANIEQQFYHGGKVSWLNFWLADHGFVEEVIKRDAYYDVSKLLNDALKSNTTQSPVNSINIYHHPGSGGSTVARQVLWNNRKDIRCAVVKPSYSAALVAEHAVKLREYEEKVPQRCLPVLLLIEDSNKEYLEYLRNELEVAINNKRIQNGTLCFILLSCLRAYDPEKNSMESPLLSVSVTHKLSGREKNKFSAKRGILEEKYEADFILTFVLMSREFKMEYIRQFVEHVLTGIDQESVVTRLIRYVALLNTYVQNSFISESHCEAFLALTTHLERFHQQQFENSLSPQAKLVFLHLRDENTHIASVKIIHPLVAKEILQQLLGNQKTQSSLAMDLLHENVLFEQRFGRDKSFLRALFIKRARISEGDGYDSSFSPFIEHVLENEKSPEDAIELLKEAFQCFHEDPMFAQHLARLHYTYEMFEAAKHWAETAARQLPNNSYILDTKGQVYRKWFQAKCKALDSDKVPKTAKNTADAVETALKALESFQECEKAAVADMKHVNNSGYFSEVNVGCSLLKLISSLDVFAKGTDGHSENMKYLLTNYIPEEVKEVWEPFHGRLKNLHKTIPDALEFISEDLCYFQTDIDADEEATPESSEKLSHPLTWLGKKSSEFGKYFSEVHATSFQKQVQLTTFQNRMKIYSLGGANMISILSKWTDQKDAVQLLETILSFYLSNPIRANFDQKDIINYIVSHITLNSLSPQNQWVVPLKELQTLSRQLPTDKRKCLPGALFLLTLLFWPEDGDTDQEKETKYEIVRSAVEHLERGYWTKMKDIPQRKRRIYTHFFLGSGNGLDKFVHKKKFESITKGFSVSEKRMKWFKGETWKNPEIAKMLKSVSGWTEDGVVYLEGPQKKKFSITPLNVPSVPHGIENITFYLGFTFRGPVACNIVVTT